MKIEGSTFIWWVLMINNSGADAFWWLSNSVCIHKLNVRTLFETLISFVAKDKMIEHITCGLMYLVLFCALVGTG
jgi:hypothetical protein